VKAVSSQWWDSGTAIVGSVSKYSPRFTL